MLELRSFVSEAEPIAIVSVPDKQFSQSCRSTRLPRPGRIVCELYGLSNVDPAEVRAGDSVWTDGGRLRFQNRRNPPADRASGI
jgi:hypothetical protein